MLGCGREGAQWCVGCGREGTEWVCPVLVERVEVTIMTFIYLVKYHVYHNMHLRLRIL